MTLLSTILQNDTVKVMVLDNQKSFIECLKEPNSLIALAAILISVIGFIFSVRYNRKTLKQSEEYNTKTLEQTLKHNKLSIVPLLKTTLATVSKINSIEYVLENCGLGTAKIISLLVCVGNKEFKNFADFFEENNIKTNDESINYFMFQETHLSSNDKIMLFKFVFDTKDELIEFTSLLNNANLIVKYENLYGDEMCYKDEQIYNSENLYK